MAATWRFSKITRWTATSSSRRRASSTSCSKRACSCLKAAPFVVEDFEIRKPLILPDPASGVHIELSYDANERTFAIQSRFDQGAAWSLHVVGSMRGERTESVFASTTWESAATPGREPVEVEGFYRYMSDLGLRYGEEFRPIRELSAGAGNSAGRVALSEAIAPARVNMRCIRCFSTARCRPSPPAPRRSRIAARG